MSSTDPLQALYDDPAVMNAMEVLKEHAITGEQFDRLIGQQAKAEVRIEPPTCSMCRRERTLDDAYDYNPIQAITGKPLGWYSGDDGQVCPECMTKTLRNQ